MEKVLNITFYVFLLCNILLVQAQSPYANRVFEYCPAPGQFINKAYPVYEEGDNYDDILQRVSDVLAGRIEYGIVCLGSWGGYIVLGFDHAVENRADTVDFKIYGNAHSNSAEPGIVAVSKDVNGNGLPDDPWYELAGSEYHSPSSLRDYSCTYYRPSPPDGNILWKDNRADSGYVLRNNAYHSQASYYPLWIEEDSLTFVGSRLAPNAQGSASSWSSPPYDWGYADNWPNTDPNTCFDIAWAVDDQGQPVFLDQINFVRIHTAVQQQLGWLGETSTEVSGIEDLHITLPILGSEHTDLQFLTDSRKLYVQAPKGSKIEIYSVQGILFFSEKLDTGPVLNIGSEELVLGQYLLDFLPQNIYIVRLSGSWGTVSSRIR